MPHVVMLVNKFPPVPAGGAERQAERLATYLAATGVSVGVITRGAAQLPRQEQRNGYWIERVPQPGIGKLKTVTFMVGALWSLWRRRHEYQILHAHLAFAPALLGALIARLLHKRVIVKYGTSGPYGDIAVSQATRRGRVRLALLRRWTDVSIVLDERMEQELLEAGFPAERVLRVDNGIDVQPFLNLPRAQHRSDLHLDQRQVLLYTGRLVEQKGLPLLLESVAELVPHHPKLLLILLGQGPDQAALERQIERLGLQNHVRFPGNVQDVRPYLAAADLFVLPSLGEGISNALLEAMAAGLPCIATDVGGSAEVLDHGRAGILIPAQQQAELTNAIHNCISNPARRTALGQAAQQRILERYAFPIVGDTYQALYNHLISNSSQTVHQALSQVQKS